MSYLVAGAVQRLIAEVKAAYPGSGPFGTIGDAAHQSRWEDSDHNPWLNNTVRAVDISGAPLQGIAERVRQLGLSGDPRMAGGGYVIFNRRIASAKGGWAWRAYSGSNPHTTHVHVSVSRDVAGYNSTATWGITAGDLPIGPIVGDGGVSGPSTNPYITAGPGYTTVTPPPYSGTPQNWARGTARLRWAASSWVGQRAVEATVSTIADDPFVQDLGQPRTSEISVARYRYLGPEASGYMVTFSVTAAHSFYDAHWNVGVWLTDASQVRYPRAGFHIEPSWSLAVQLQILDGIGTYAGAFFVPTREFTVALLSDWAAYGDLPPDILDGESRVRTADMTVLSIEPAPFGIAGMLSSFEGLIESDFNGIGVPGTMDIERPSTFTGVGCV